MSLPALELFLYYLGL